MQKMIELIKQIREINVDVSFEDMQMIHDINRIILNLRFMKELLEKSND